MRLYTAKENRARLWTWCAKTVYMRVIEVMCAAVIAGPQATAKGLRHGFAVACIPKNIPLNLVQRWLGHAYISTTAIYANTIGEEEHSIAARLDMTDPYNSSRQLENLLRQQEQIQRFATSTLLQDVAEQFRKGEQIQRLATSSLVHNTVEQFI